jgi:hypothetical protein
MLMKAREISLLRAVDEHGKVITISMNTLRLKDIERRLLYVHLRKEAIEKMNEAINDLRTCDGLEYQECYNYYIRCRERIREAWEARKAIG